MPTKEVPTWLRVRTPKGCERAIKQAWVAVQGAPNATLDPLVAGLVNELSWPLKPQATPKTGRTLKTWLDKGGHPSLSSASFSVARELLFRTFCRLAPDTARPLLAKVACQVDSDDCLVLAAVQLHAFSDGQCRELLQQPPVFNNSQIVFDATYQLGLALAHREGVSTALLQRRAKVLRTQAAKSGYDGAAYDGMLLCCIALLFRDPKTGVVFVRALRDRCLGKPAAPKTKHAKPAAKAKARKKLLDDGMQVAAMAFKEVLSRLATKTTDRREFEAKQP